MTAYDTFMMKVQQGWRMALFIGILVFMVSFLVYTYLSSMISGGIVKSGDLNIVDLKAMSTFTLDQDNGTTLDIPQRFRALDGQRVMLTGEMWAPVSASGRLGGFQLVYSISKCCFSGPPLIQHFVKAKVANGGKVDWHDGLVNVVGTLHVGVIQRDGHIESVYRVDVENVEPVS